MCACTLCISVLTCVLMCACLCVCECVCVTPKTAVLVHARNRGSYPPYHKSRVPAIRENFIKASCVCAGPNRRTATPAGAAQPGAGRACHGPQHQPPHWVRVGLLARRWSGSGPARGTMTRLLLDRLRRTPSRYAIRIAMRFEVISRALLDI